MGDPAGGRRRRHRAGGDPLGLRARQRRHALVLWGLAVLLLLSALVAAGLGAVAVPPATTAAVVGHQLLGWPVEPTWSVQEQAVVWDVRAPRVLLAAAVGAGLAVCGAALQAMVRNVLADPYVLGVNSGASLGAAAAILLGALAGAGQLALPAAAFAGALGASVLVLVVARGSGVVTSLRLLLAGVGVGYALSAATSFLVFASGSAEGARSVMFWLLGSLALAGWGLPLAVVLVVTAFTAAVLLLLGPRLDALAIGDETAQALGVVPAVLRVQLVVLVSLCVGVLVASSGSIGFVGLVVPHLARRLVGAAHRQLVPASALLGAVLLIWSDLAARTVLAPQELPIGIVTALVGAPFLLHLVRRHHATT